MITTLLSTGILSVVISLFLLGACPWESSRLWEKILVPIECAAAVWVILLVICAISYGLYCLVSLVL